MAESLPRADRARDVSWPPTIKKRRETQPEQVTYVWNRGALGDLPMGYGRENAIEPGMLQVRPRRYERGAIQLFRV